jgi:hypothetical protein
MGLGFIGIFFSDYFAFGSSSAKPTKLWVGWESYVCFFYSLELIVVSSMLLNVLKVLAVL